MQNKPTTSPDDMTHPPQERWMEYIYGELPKPQLASLAAHLKACPACAAQVARWGAVQSQLDEWKLPEAKRMRWMPAAVKWAMAAAFIIAALGAGFGAGRASGTKALRGEMQVALQKAYEDNRLLLTAIERLDAARQAEILALRRDLETVAINADNTFKEIQFAALYQAGQTTEE